MGANIAVFLLICSMLVQVSLGSRARLRNADSSNPKAHTTSTMTAHEVEKLMDDSVASKKVVLFSTTWCRWCAEPKKILAKYDIPPEQYQLWEIDLEPKHEHIWAHLKQITDGALVPRVFINGKFIGGHVDDLHQSGQLATLLNTN